MSSPITRLHELGQSLWYDNIERRLLENGEMAALIARGDIRGVTSNPSIFKNAIAASQDYDAALLPLAWSGWEAVRIYEQLAIEDIRAACDLFLPLYEQSAGGDGYVSLEVDPRLARHGDATLADARRLWQAVGRPNLMIKIPATSEGLPAIRQAIAAGINVNVTLIFSLRRYRQVMEAYLAGLEDRLAAGQPLQNVASVASFFVSRFDTKLDPWLASQAPQWAGKTALACAKLAYQDFKTVFDGPRFAALAAHGARLQRPLWASTSTKNPAYSPTLYVDHLIGPHTVNTVPPATLEAFRQQGQATLSLENDLDAAQRTFDALAELGVSMEQVAQELEEEGVQRFAADFEALLAAIEKRRQAAVDELGPLAGAVAKRVARLAAENAPARLWAQDASLWTSDPKGQAEIRNRLGWLNAPAQFARTLPAELAAFAAEVQVAGMDRALLLGMGGSSLGPEVMSLVFGRADRFAILDSTDPAQVLAAARKFPVKHTLFIVSSKSGGTAEVNALLEFFWERARRRLGQRAGEHFVAITDPGTSLESEAHRRGFRRIFLGEPSVGGRFSVLSPFGLVPAALMGLDTSRLLERARWMAAQCRDDVPAERNPGLVLGALLAEAALQGRDKLTLFADAPWESFGAWLEQLVAESSGKNGMGIVPVDGEPPAAASIYAHDRLFVYLRSAGRRDAAVARLRRAGFPVIIFRLSQAYDLGAEFYRWSIATAVACAVLGVNAFDQPDVQDNKTRTLAKIEAFKKLGALEAGQFVMLGPSTPTDIARLLAQRRPGDYLAINAYLPRNRRTAARLRALRQLLRAKTGLATTVGFGPRFLHSTGQLHKGGADNGLFLQITAEAAEDVPIPGQGLTFATLERAQALGDYEALQARQRRLLRLHLPSAESLRELLKMLEKMPSAG